MCGHLLSEASRPPQPQEGRLRLLLPSLCAGFSLHVCPDLGRLGGIFYAYHPCLHEIMSNGLLGV